MSPVGPSLGDTSISSVHSALAPALLTPWGRWLSPSHFASPLICSVFSAPKAADPCEHEFLGVSGCLRHPALGRPPRAAGPGSGVSWGVRWVPGAISGGRYEHFSEVYRPTLGFTFPMSAGKFEATPPKCEVGLLPTAASPTAGYSHPSRMLTKAVACRRREAEPPKPWSCSSSLVPSSCFSRAHLLAASSSCEGPILGCSGGVTLSLPRSGGAGDAHLPLHCSPTGLCLL